MTNNNIYFVANWKMFGDVKSINSLNKVIKLTKSKKYKNIKIIYCPPYTLLDRLVGKTKNYNIDIGGQDCHFDMNSGAFTGSISSMQIKKLGCKFVILGHSEKRNDGDTNFIINKKIKSALNSKLNVIFCIGETKQEKKRNKTFEVLKKQIFECLKNIKIKNNLLIAYEPVWSIGTGNVLYHDDLKLVINKLKNIVKKKYNKHIKILYGGSVNTKNISELKKVNNIDGFLIGNASRNVNKFIDIIKKSSN